jgi:sigma-B regulation protein RsbU (phosphoserine phosphatase)
MLEIAAVVPGGPAEQAGLRAGDQVVAVDGRPVRGLSDPIRAGLVRKRPGDTLTLDVKRPGASAPLTFTAVLAPRQEELARPWAARVASELLGSYPVLFLVVGLVVVFLRLDDRNAWLLAILFAGFIASAPLIMLEAMIHPALRGFAVSYMVLFYAISAAIFNYFFATFPAPSPIDRKLPWLKWVFVIPGFAVSVPLAVSVLWAGDSHPLLIAAIKTRTPLTRPLVIAYVMGGFLLGLASLVANAAFGSTRTVRRKTRVIVWGTVVGFAPVLVLSVLSIYLRKDIYQFPFWMWASAVLATFLIPLSMAYAVVKHRVLEIPALVKRSARYLLVQRGFLFLMVLLGLAATFWLAQYLAARFPQGTKLAVPLGAIFGVALVVSGAKLHERVRQRIDRAFFRSAYDARQIMEDLAAKTRVAKNRTELAVLLEGHLQDALHPTRVAIYMETGKGELGLQCGHAPHEAQTVSADLPGLLELRARGQPWDVVPTDSTKDQEGFRRFWEGSFQRLDALHLLGPLSALDPECLVPISDRSGQLCGLVVLGARRSEEPYSGEDKRLLASIASQAGAALENIALAEEIAERLQAERRAAQEMEIARQVQRKLFPQKLPPLATLDYAGDCVQARIVGGDYYDFLDLGVGRVGFVLADIAGKGISAALLMANLQANLRSQYAVALDDLSGLLRSVNKLFYENTEPSHYATFFFGAYDDATRTLLYANCGHNPPLLLRCHGPCERLAATATVLGLFEDWECALGRVNIAPGDLLVVYTDGVTEAVNQNEEEFGEARLAETAMAARTRGAEPVLRSVLDQVARFTVGEQGDDLTLVVACGR